MSEPQYTKAYEALGRFVEAFESMVHETRSIAIRLLSDGKNTYHHDLIEIAFHHNCMTAKPLFEIFRAIVIKMVSASIEAQEFRKKSGRDDWPLPIADSRRRPVDFTSCDRDTFDLVHGSAEGRETRAFETLAKISDICFRYA